MGETTKKCPRCNSQTEKGLMVTPGSNWIIRWVKDKSGLLRTVLPGHPKIVSYKCVKCGYIENYVET